MSNNWFDEVAEAMRKRETALNGIERWREKLVAAEKRIAELSAQAPAVPSTSEPTPTISEPTPTVSEAAPTVSETAPTVDTNGDAELQSAVA